MISLSVCERIMKVQNGYIIFNLLCPISGDRETVICSTIEDVFSKLYGVCVDEGGIKNG